ncbi:YdcF family protein [Dyadobacter sp. CY261]|uniref:YdcF family protein n=1 Tax=Dyadobacter sp. CY261 TaxID=2907203 RepID=UPI001F1FAE63|nr:YdcF family protein [Dyadobacter sp. CY261]MCF0073580.1 YdcF family protein [Dyadobacter sp. CY261]
MFYFLSKAVDFLIMPMSMLFLLLIYAFIVKNARKRKLTIGLVILLLFLMSNSFLVRTALNLYEAPLVNISDLKETYDVGILLSGGLINTDMPEADHALMGDRGDRVLQTFLLYKAGKIKKILITGISSDDAMVAARGETKVAASLLVKWGVPAGDIVFEEKAKNTRENALFSARILNKMFPGGKYVLITSAFHMRRSVGCFEKAGIKTKPFPADYYGGYSTWSFRKVVPEPVALYDFNVLWHELVGLAIYKIMGYC